MPRTKGPKGIFYGEHSIPPKRYVCSEEFRAPKKGEYFLSGAIVTAYKCVRDMPEEYKYWIAKEVRMVKCEHCNGHGEVADLA